MASDPSGRTTSGGAAVDNDLAARVRAAHGDAWQEQGRLRVAQGGGAAELPGARVMASGLAHPQWNNADVHDAAVDINRVQEWYAARGVPWGVRVPSGMPFAVGTHLFSKRLMGLTPAQFTAHPLQPSLTMRPATSDDVDAVVHIDAVAFESTPDVERPWVEPHLTWPRATVVLATLDGEPVGTAYSVRSDGWAGPALYLAGTGVLPEARGRGVAAAMTSWLVHRGIAAGARLAHLHPDTDAAARVYARLGFVEVDGFEVYVDLA